MVVVVVFRRSAAPKFVPERGDRGQDQQDAGGDQERAQTLLDVAQVEIGQAGPQHRPADQQQDHRLSLAIHSTTNPTPVATRIARTNVAGAKRTAKRRPKTPACIAKSLRSIIGPTVRNTSRAVSENWVSEAATNASASEQIDSSTASTARPSPASTGAVATELSHLAGTITLREAAAAAPTTRNPPACMTSWRAELQNA